jgi:hypothetical protein
MTSEVNRIITDEEYKTDQYVEKYKTNSRFIQANDLCSHLISKGLHGGLVFWTITEKYKLKVSLTVII